MPRAVGPGDDLDFPQGPGAVERNREQGGDVLADCLDASVVEHHPVHVPVDGEVDVVLPHPDPVVLDGHLRQDPVLADHALHDEVGDCIDIREFVEADQAVDVHEVVRLVHQQPREVFRRDSCCHVRLLRHVDDGSCLAASW